MAKEFYDLQYYLSHIKEKPGRQSFVDLEGSVINEITVLKWAENSSGRNKWWCQCSCDADNYFMVDASTLQKRITKSCGCAYKSNGGNTAMSLGDFQDTVTRWKVLTYNGHNYPSECECLSCGSRVTFDVARSALLNHCEKCNTHIIDKRHAYWAELGYSEIKDNGDYSYDIVCNNCGLDYESSKMSSTVKCPCADHSDKDAIGVYILSSATKPYIKIGKSVDPYSRCRNINSSGGDDFRVEHIEYVRGIRCAYAIEHWLHTKLGGKDHSTRPGFSGDTEIFYCDVGEALNKLETIKSTLNIMKEEMSEPRKCILPEVSQHSIEFNGNWYPSLVYMSDYMDIPRSYIIENLTKVNTESQLYGKYIFNNETFYTFYGYPNEQVMNEDLISNYGTSVERVKTLMQKHKLSFFEARLVGVKRTMRHIINGVNKTNKEWYEHFNLKPRSANSKLNQLGGDMRKTLEFYGIDTTEMDIKKHI